ncbi:hypothetical protein PISMIDRAFT_679354, partial [Pisolithus microcarpus 441]
YRPLSFTFRGIRAGLISTERDMWRRLCSGRRTCQVSERTPFGSQFGCSLGIDGIAAPPRNELCL